MNIAYATTYNPADIKKWSGLGYYIAEALRKQNLNVFNLGPLKDRYFLSAWVKQRFYRKIYGKSFLRDRTTFLQDHFASQISEKLSKLDVDVIFSAGPISIANLKTDLPIVVYSDAIFGAMVDFYPEYKAVCRESIRDAVDIEKRTLQRSNLAIFSSEWAANSAVELYDIDSAKIKIIPFGANFNKQLSPAEVRLTINNRPTDSCNLLFIGLEWLRKGGDIAYRVAHRLVKNGFKVKLRIVGCQPDFTGANQDFVEILGKIDKTHETGQEKLCNLLAESHYLILPSRADCTPVVFSEANSWGVPCISTNCGGIPSIIKDDVNGKLFPVNPDISEICGYIESNFNSYNDYKRLALSSYNQYSVRLNWKITGEKIKQYLDNIAS